ncbi:transmembrane protein [Thraustotheca clavata]|uniref:Choline transporter-like protein n=1 Tax=Thraustotheca clavata TaxID=74557 RepID=A0A1V9ZZ07_9STRA|nr:transmembrane protein [Thraustotheca clavata]
MMHDVSVPSEAEMESSSPTMASLIPLDNASIKMQSTSKPLPSLSMRPMNKDVKFGALFAIHCLITMLIVIASPKFALEAKGGVPYVGPMVVAGTIYSLLSIALFFFVPMGVFIRISTISSFVGIAPMALVLLVSPSWLGFFVSIGVLAIAFSDWIWTKKNKLGFDFVAVVFELVTTVAKELPVVVVISTIILLISSIWAYWCCQLLADVGEDEGWSISLIWMLFHFYWTSHLFKMFIAVITSGTVMFWYHHWGDDQPESPTVPMVLTSPRSVSSRNLSLDDEPKPASSKVSSATIVLHYTRVAMTCVFGSVCLGALLCPIAHLLWNVLRMAKRDGSYKWLRGIVLPIAHRIDAFTQLYHKYTFAYVATYALSFSTAASEVWTLFEECGIEAMVDDDLTSRLLLFTANGCAGCMGTLACVMLFGSHLQVYGTVLSFLVGYSVSSTATTMMNAAVKTFFVCFAQNPSQTGSEMLALRQIDGESTWTDHWYLSKLNDSNGFPRSLNNISNISGVISDGNQLTCISCPIHCPDATTLLILHLPKPTIIATGALVLEFVREFQKSFPTLVKIRPSFESDTESDEDEEAVKERKKRKLHTNQVIEDPAVVAEAYCSKWEGSIKVLDQEHLDPEIDHLQVDPSLIHRVFNEKHLDFSYILIILPPVLNPQEHLNFGLVLSHRMLNTNYLTIPTPLLSTVPSQNIMHTQSIYTFNGIREATETGAGKTSSEMLDNIRRRHASGTFTKLIPPSTTWSHLSNTFISSIPQLLDLQGDIRLRKVLHILPMEPIRIHLCKDTSNE